MKNRMLFGVTLIVLFGLLFSAIPSSDRVWIRVGSLQSQVDAWGAERAWNANMSKYEGLQWPAWSDKTDNFVIDRSFMACRNFIAQSGDTAEYKSVKFSAFAGPTQIIPQLLEQSALHASEIIVNGVTLNSNDCNVYHQIGDSRADRVVTNIVRSTMGVTMTRKVYAFSHPYHDNYLITEYIFTNSGHIDDSDTVKLHNTIEDFYFGIITRYATSGELGYASVGMRQGSWGAHQWVHHTPIQDDPELPYVYSWLGQGQTSDIILNYNSVGMPYLPSEGSIENARIRCPQFAGKAVLHADKAYNNVSNEKNNVRLGWYIGDATPPEGADEQIWQLLSDNYLDRGFFDVAQDIYAGHKLADRKSPWSVIKNVDAAGTNAYLSFGPYDIPHEESIKIVVVEGVSGLSRGKAIEVGKNWYKAYNGELIDLDLPPAPLYRDPEVIDPAASDMDVYKDMWVYTGKDSLVQTFMRAKEMYDSGFNLSAPPPPPASFEVIQQSEGVILEWSGNSMEDADFEGYRVYRATQQADSSYHIIFDCSVTADNCTTSFIDNDIILDTDYYYYVVAFKTDPEWGELESGRAYTQTTLPSTFVNVRELRPQTFTLYQNYPNPFNPSTCIRVELPESGELVLDILDIRGRVVDHMLMNKPAGTHEIPYAPKQLSTGIYFIRARFKDRIQMQKIMYLK